MVVRRVGGVEFDIGVDVGAFDRDMIRAAAVATVNSRKISRAIEEEVGKIDKSLKAATGSQNNFLSTFGKFGAALVVQQALQSAILGVVAATDRAATANNALAVLYKKNTDEMRATTQLLAEQTKKAAQEFELAAVKVAGLGREYGATLQQQKLLLSITADYAALLRTDIADAIERITNAARGEAESAEKLNLILNETAVATWAFGDANKSAWEALTEREKTQLRLAKILEDSKQVEGEAAKRAKSLEGNWDALTKAGNDLGVSLGYIFGPPVLAGIGLVATGVQGLADAIDDTRANLGSLAPIVARLVLSVSPLFALLNLAAVIQNPDEPKEAYTYRSARERRADAAAKEAEEKRIAEEQTRAEKERIVKTAIIRRQLEDAIKLNVKYLDELQELYDKQYEADRIQLEVRREEEIKALTDYVDELLESLAQEEQARARNNEIIIALIEQRRQAEKQELEDARDDELRALEVELDAIRSANEEQIRLAGIARDAEIRAAEETRDRTIAALDVEKRAREEARIVEDRAADDDTTRRSRAIEDAHRRNTRALEDETEEVRRNKEKRIQAIEDEADALRRAEARRKNSAEESKDIENERHRLAMQAIEDEKDARFEAVDSQIKALKLQKEQADEAQRLVDLQRKVADASEKLAKALGSGDRERGEAAQKVLTEALRRGDAIAARAARAELDAAYGTGNPEEIAEAQRNLIESQEDLQQEVVEQQQSAEIRKLEATKDAIAKEIEARKRAEEEIHRQREREVEADARAEDSKLDKRLQALEKRKRAVAASTQDELDNIDRRRRSEQDANEDAQRDLQDSVEDAKRKLDDKRRHEDQADADRREEVRKQYEDEREQIRLTYDDEAVGAIPQLRRAVNTTKELYEQRARDIRERFEEEQRALERRYNDPVTGELPLARRAEQEAKQAYENRRAAVVKAFNEEKQAIQDRYSNTAKTGELDLLAQVKEETDKSIDKQKEKWGELKSSMNDANVELQLILDHIRELDKLGVVTVETVPRKPEESGTGSGSTARGPSTAPIRAGTAPSPWSVNFPFDAPYTGGPAWPGGPTHHRGVDLTLPGPNQGLGTPYPAFRSGVVVAAGPMTYPSGNGVIIQTEDGTYDAYFHNSAVHVNAGDYVERGRGHIATLGEEGTPGNPHVHYEVRRQLNGDAVGNTIDPTAAMFSGATGDSTPQVAKYGDDLVITIFGRRFRISNPTGASYWYAAAKKAAEEAEFSNPDLFARQMRLESAGFDPDVIAGRRDSSAGARGIAQFMPALAEELGVDPLNPGAALRAAAKYMRDLERKYGSVSDALWIYNAGIGNYLNNIMPEETERYLEQLRGYKDGTMITQKTLLVGRNGPYGWAGEAGAEELLSVDETRSRRDGKQVVVNFNGTTDMETYRKFKTWDARHEVMGRRRGSR